MSMALVACAAPSTTESPSPSLGTVGGESCSPIEMQGPSGTRFLLTGVWQVAGAGRYFMQQDGSCLYWFGQSEDLDAVPGSAWANTFFGHIHADFSIVGDWGDVPFHEGAILGSGTLNLVIDFDETGPIEHPILRTTSGTGGFGGTAWQLEDTLPPPAEFLGTFGHSLAADQEVNCEWLDTAGGRYQLLGGVPPTRVAPADGAPIRVVGRLAPELGTGCAPSAILVDELEDQ